VCVLHQLVCGGASRALAPRACCVSARQLTGRAAAAPAAGRHARRGTRRAALHARHAAARLAARRRVEARRSGSSCFSPLCAFV
jgi:hypothetical protein